MKLVPRLFAVLVMTILFSTIGLAQWNSAAPRDGACFYTDFNFRGESFCMAAGESANAVPSNFNDRIRSIRVFGRAEVRFYNAANFGGPSESTSRDIRDLSMLQLREDRSRHWATRISSIQIVGGGWGRGRDDDRGRDRWGRDHDRDDWRDRRSNTVSCSAGMGNHRVWCSTPGRVHRVEIVRENGRRSCEWNRTYGIDDGRLWTARGCSGTFEVR